METGEQRNQDEPVEPANLSEWIGRSDQGEEIEQTKQSGNKKSVTDEGKRPGSSMLMMAVHSDAVHKALLLFLATLGIGLFAWWSRGLCEMALSFWRAASPVSGAVVICFWLFCLTALLGILIIAVGRVIRDSEWDVGEYNEAIDRLVALQATVNRISNEISRDSNCSNEAGK